MQYENPKISVIIPVYNAEKTIERCLKALINQVFENFEVICINDGSKDNSMQVLLDFAQKDSRIKVFDQENSGPAKTRYNAIKKARGEYIMFCDADDWFEATMVEQMYSTIVEQNVDLVMCDSNIVDIAQGKLQNKRIKRAQLLSTVGFADIKENSSKFINPTLWNKIFKKELMTQYKIEYPQQYEHDDAIFVLKYCAWAKTYYGLDKKLYNYVVGNPESIMGKVYTKTNKKNPFDFILAFRDLYSFLENHPESKERLPYIINFHFMIIGGFYKILDKDLQKEAFLCLKTFIMDNPVVLTNEKFKNVSEMDSFEEFHKMMTKKVKIKTKERTKTTLLEKLFSIKNEERHKVIRIFGIKLKFYRRYINA